MIYEEVGKEPLRLRRWFHRLTEFYMMMHRLTPQSIFDRFPPLRRQYFGSYSRNLLPYSRPFCNPGTLEDIGPKRLVRAMTTVYLTLLL